MDTVASGLGEYFELGRPIEAAEVLSGIFEAARGDDDKVNFDEAKGTLKKLGFKIKDEDIEKFGMALDKDGDEQVSKEELDRWMTQGEQATTA